MDFSKVLFLLCGLVLNLQGEETASAEDSPSAALVDPAGDGELSGAPTTPEKSARTFIPHPLEAPVFTPPVPVVRKPPPPVRIRASVTLPSKNSRTFTLQRGEPSTQPDLPPPPPPPPYVEPKEPTPEQIAQRIWYLRHTLNLGATIFDHKTSVVTWTDPISHEFYEAVCGFDIGLLAGVGNFVHKGEDYGFFLMHSHFDTTLVRRFAGQWHFRIPEVGKGEILFTRGNTADSAATAPMSIIKEVIAAEEARLVPYQAARKIYFAASAAWHAAHPPVPRDETFIFSPHRGSRFLPAAKPIHPSKP